MTPLASAHKVRELGAATTTDNMESNQGTTSGAAGLRLHLGCGQVHLAGYVNIDYPPAEHSVQVTPVADKYADLRTLTFPQGSVAEVRLHHVFEHFQRTVACGLLLGWRNWLRDDGVLRLEVPDFRRTSAWMHLAPWRRKQWTVGLRHLYGSNEADWAVHYEGWSPRQLKACLTLFGYEVQAVDRNSWKGTYNCEVLAGRGAAVWEESKALELAEKYLERFLLDRSPGELRLLEVWMGQVHQQLVAM